MSTDAPSDSSASHTGEDVAGPSQPTPASHSEIQSTALFGDDVLARVRAAVSAHEAEATSLDVSGDDESATPTTETDDTSAFDDTAEGDEFAASAPDDEELHTLQRRPEDPPSTTASSTPIDVDALEREEEQEESASPYAFTSSEADGTELYAPEPDNPIIAKTTTGEAPAARMMVSGEYLATDGQLAGGAGATSMYIPTSAVLEAVAAAENAESQSEVSSVETPGEESSGTSKAPSDTSDELLSGRAKPATDDNLMSATVLEIPKEAIEAALEGAAAVTTHDASPQGESEPDVAGVVEQDSADESEDASAVSTAEFAPVEKTLPRQRDEKKSNFRSTVAFDINDMDFDALAAGKEEADKKDEPPKAAPATSAPSLGATVMFGVDLDALNELAEEAAAKREEAKEEDGAGGGSSSDSADKDVSGSAYKPTQDASAFQSPYQIDDAQDTEKVDNSFQQSRIDRKAMQQTVAIDDMPSHMAKIAEMVEAEKAAKASKSDAKKTSSRRVSLGQTMAMDAMEIEQWAVDMGVAPEAEVDEKIEDATARLAQAERAVDEARYPEAIELYLSLMRAFPSDAQYQQRLEHVWALMREQDVSSLELPAVPVAPAGEMSQEKLPWSQEQGKRIHLFWGAGVGLLLLLFGVLGFVWPGFLKPATKVGLEVRPTPRGSRMASMQINSTPIGASIWLDGKNTGHKTPMTLQKQPGTYALALQLEGYRPLKKKISLKPGMSFAIEFALAPKEDNAVEPPPVAIRTAPTGLRMVRRPRKRATHTTLLLRSRPAGASISIDDKRISQKTPASVRLAVGRYQVQLQRPGYQTYIRDVALSRARQTLSVRLVRAAQQAQTRLSLNTQPAGASISIDGKLSSQVTPAVLPLSPKTMVVSLALKGYRTKTQKLTLKQGETRRIDVKMVKRGPADMAYVRSGHFWMGNNAGISREKPMRKVYMRGFYIDRNEVTVRQYKACVAAGRCRKAGRKRGCNAGKSGRGNHPINCVSWYDAVKYCRWQKKRLPTEAEWEKAARGTTTQLYPWGHSSPSCSKAVFGQKCSAYGTRPVASRSGGRSRYGANDMSGNVWEWVYDFFDRNYYSKAANRNPFNRFRGSGYRVIRGGAWNTRSDQLHVTYRLEYWPNRRSNSIGFRCAR